VSGLENVKHVKVPADVVTSVHAHLRDAGASGFEGVGFWAGQVEGDTFLVRAAVVPAQWGQRSQSGVSVVVGGDELFRMNVWLHKNGLTLIAQLHSHPGDAYHSETDDDFAIMTRVGGLSIVVPNFAREPFSFDTAAIYRLAEKGQWSSLTSDEARALIHIET
jgi:proteasome lid subunit RPN8/RPN11